MYASQLERVMRTDSIGKRQFRGVFAADRLPRTVPQYPSSYIVNTDPASKPGTHWVAFYFPNKDQGEFFDSYGQTPEFYHRAFENFLNHNSYRWTYNRIALQSLTSNACGQYCLWYLLHRSRGISIARTLGYFRKDKDWNDRMVKTFIYNRFHEHLRQKTCKPSQMCVSVYSK